MRYPVDVNESFQKDIISNNNILDIPTRNPTTNKNISIKDDNKEKFILTREQSEERINISLMFLTIPFSLVLLGFLSKILLVLQTNNHDLLIFTRSEGDYDNTALIL